MLAAGELVGVAEVGILATVGAAQLPVYRRPLVAVLSTGESPSSTSLPCKFIFSTLYLYGFWCAFWGILGEFATCISSPGPRADSHSNWRYIHAYVPVSVSVQLCLVSVFCGAGDEVVDPCGPSPPGPGQIRDANRAMMLAAAAAAGAQTLDLGIARDVEGHLEGALEKALAAGADVLITSGGRGGGGGREECWKGDAGAILLAGRGLHRFADRYRVERG